MAMTLRLPDDTQELLRELSDAEHRSMNDIVARAVEFYAERNSKSARTRAIMDRIQTRDAELLEALSK